MFGYFPRSLSVYFHNNINDICLFAVLCTHIPRHILHPMLFIVVFVVGFRWPDFFFVFSKQNDLIKIVFK